MKKEIKLYNVIFNDHETGQGVESITSHTIKEEAQAALQLKFIEALTDIGFDTDEIGDIMKGCDESGEPATAYWWTDDRHYNIIGAIFESTVTMEI